LVETRDEEKTCVVLVSSAFLDKDTWGFLVKTRNAFIKRDNETFWLKRAGLVKTRYAAKARDVSLTLRRPPDMRCMVGNHCFVFKVKVSS